MKALLTLFCTFILFQGCASKPEIKTVASSEQKTDYDGAVVSQKKHLVSLSPYTDFKVNKLIKDKTIFHMLIQNCGEKPIFINRDNISVSFEENGGEMSSRSIKIDSPLEMMRYKGQSMKSRFPYSMTSVSDAHEEYIQDMEERRRHELKVLRDVLPKITLKSHTIIPDEAISVIFFCDTEELGPKTEGRFEIVITIDDEKHEFLFTRSIE